MIMIIIPVEEISRGCLPMNTKNLKFDVVIVGAGAAGIGCGAFVTT